MMNLLVKKRKTAVAYMLQSTKTQTHIDRGAPSPPKLCAQPRWVVQKAHREDHILRIGYQNSTRDLTVMNVDADADNRICRRPRFKLNSSDVIGIEVQRKEQPQLPNRE